jgi:hypothetical protein
LGKYIGLTARTGSEMLTCFKKVCSREGVEVALYDTYQAILDVVDKVVRRPAEVKEVIVDINELLYGSDWSRENPDLLLPGKLMIYMCIKRLCLSYNWPSCVCNHLNVGKAIGVCVDVMEVISEAMLEMEMDDFQWTPLDEVAEEIEGGGEVVTNFASGKLFHDLHKKCTEVYGEDVKVLVLSCNVDDTVLDKTGKKSVCPIYIKFMNLQGNEANKKANIRLLGFAPVMTVRVLYDCFCAFLIMM